MSIRVVIAVILGVALISCEETAQLERTFHIKKGEHYSSPRVVETLQSTALVFEAKFNASAIYQFEQKGFQDSKNKLYGFSDCNSAHQENSARFAWQWYNDRLEIFAYCYVDGVRVEQFIGTISLETFHHYELQLTESAYIFRLNDFPLVIIPRGNVCHRGVYYKLWPYFGGTLPAPHPVQITIREMP